MNVLRARLVAVAALTAGPGGTTALAFFCRAPSRRASSSASSESVAVGDVHGAYDAFVGILRTAGLVDERQRVDWRQSTSRSDRRRRRPRS